MEKVRTPIYPVEAWEITETAFEEKNNYRNETTFALSNGYIGTRGTFEEGYPFDIDTGLEGNFINGFYESEQIRYGEANFGSPLRSQSLLNLPNLKETRVLLDGEPFDMRTGKTEEYSRKLHLKEGVLERSLLWTSPDGRKARLRFLRLVSFARKNVMAVRCEVTPLNFDGAVTFVSKLQADVENHTRKTNPIVDYGPFGRRLLTDALEADGDTLYYEGTTKGSLLSMACGSRHALYAAPDGETEGKIAKDISVQAESAIKDLQATISYNISARCGQTVILEKMICYTSALDMKKEEMKPFVQEGLADAVKAGWKELAKQQRAYTEAFWRTGDVRVRGDAALQQGLRFNLFHIMQAAGRDGRTGMGAKGLSGEGYEGHYFWDTEMYVLPALIYTQPETARSLLAYRYGTLDAARARARILGHEKGALYPWRTINGEEASTYYPLGTAQYHINADIAYALSLYFQVTGDVGFFREMGAEMLIETARIWADVGSFSGRRDGKYCICCVTGPDEYNVLVDNNFYTNLMAREHLRDAVRAVQYLKEQDVQTLERLKDKLGFEEEETHLWQEIVEKMYFPYDEERRIYPMDDGFMIRKPWDESKIPPEKRSWLYENYHPLFIMRHRMSKQADAVLGLYLHSHRFTKEEIDRNYEFYQEVTLHHSSLSTCIFGIVACSVGQQEEAYRYFRQSARMDLDDHHNNFYAGIHAANMAGTWQAVVNGFAGLRCYDGALHFEPCLPEGMEGYEFHLRYRGSILAVGVERTKAVFTLEEGESLRLFVNGKDVSLEKTGGIYIEKI